MAATALIDTGAILALLDSSDPWHVPCKKIFRQLRIPLLTSEAVLTELFHFTVAKLAAMEAAWTFLRSGTIVVGTIQDAELSQLRALRPSASRKMKSSHRYGLPPRFGSATDGQSASRNVATLCSWSSTNSVRPPAGSEIKIHREQPRLDRLAEGPSSWSPVRTERASLGRKLLEVPGYSFLVTGRMFGGCRRDELQSCCGSLCIVHDGAPQFS